jgi:hypothetical protein
MHIEDYFALHGVMAMLAQAQGQTASAENIIANLQRMAVTDDDKRMLATAKARVAHAKANASPLDIFRTLGPRPQ